MTEAANGPLHGVRVVEFAGIGPGPFCSQLLGDLGAEVLVIDRAGGNGWPNAVVARGKAPLELDLRTEAGRDRALAALDRADVLIEGYRPGVMERLGLGPEAVCARNPRLVYGRMTGWGQDGPLAPSAGHDIGYVALTGALAAIGGPDGGAVPPLNLVGDFGGGSLYLALGIAAALVERERSGRGQVIDAAIVDGTASLMGFFHGAVAAGRLSVARDANVLGGAAPFYRCYTCADGKELAVGAIEPHFFRELVERTGLPPALLARQYDQAAWAADCALLAAHFATRPRDGWAALLEGSDACAAPVLTLAEAPQHPHLAARATHVTVDGVVHPAPAPRFSRTPGTIRPPADAAVLLARWGVAD